ncbi:MAG TPA: AIPR family protein, partial [bacterium]|nr:AIPR family protein [bacterium]
RSDPLSYAFDHNGVTLYVEKVELRDGKLLLTEPRLLNGAQTISSLDRFLTAHQDDPKLAEGRQALDELSVLCKIITDARSDFVLRVTLNNNRQNPIKPWNLHANDMIQLELQDKFQEELGIYYERQERAFANLDDDGEDRLLVEGKAIELLRLARTFLLSDGDLEGNSHLQQLFEDEGDYGRCFHLGRLGADSRDILLCYKVQFRLGRLIREIINKGEKKYAYLKNARSLVWALLAQALLHDAELAKHRESFGRKLGIEAGFAKWLEQLASTRVRQAIAKAAEQGPYAEKLAGEKTTFLNTRAFYRECMKQANLKWGWEPKSLGRPMKGTKGN